MQGGGCLSCFQKQDALVMDSTLNQRRDLNALHTRSMIIDNDTSRNDVHVSYISAQTGFGVENKNRKNSGLIMKGSIDNLYGDVYQDVHLITGGEQDAPVEAAHQMN